MNSLGLSFISELLRKPVFPGDQIGVEIEVTRIHGPLDEAAIPTGVLRTLIGRMLSLTGVWQNQRGQKLHFVCHSARTDHEITPHPIRIGHA